MGQIQTSHTLTTYQLTVSLLCVLLGVGVMNLPRTLTVDIGTADGWLSILFGGILITLQYAFVCFAFKRHNVHSIDEYTTKAFGAFISKAICLLLTIYFLLLGGWQAVAMSEMIRYFLLESTPHYVSIVTVLLLCAFAVYYSLPTIVRVACFFLPLTVVVLFLVLLIGFRDASILNIRPVAPEGMLPILLNSKNGLQSFQGIEVIFILLASIQKTVRPIKAGLGALMFATLLYAFTYLIVVATVGTVEVQLLTWPTITLTHASESSLLFTERADSFLITTWILQFFLTSLFTLYSAVFLLKKVFPVSRNWLIPPATISMIGLALWPQTIDDITKVSEYQQFAFVSFFFILPVTCYALVSLRKKAHL
ncbi:GerAB/ArcD/ProY family transporter [Shouchella miscanthi]|uniref:GerAB/ArcD/ProY family transporter n=1 Tax=Shouchella miscanthi TaxID=2598861 RepID=UPI0011A8D29E|nr:GerAB/ArcD/ProY family transporter [Shouchella miscanthi]